MKLFICAVQLPLGLAFDPKGPLKLQLYKCSPVIQWICLILKITLQKCVLTSLSCLAELYMNGEKLSRKRVSLMAFK